ncbi:MAG: proline racemase family protein [candidate division Zixibacteria bacterium]|nr:proline racemase family protein [candidate division Zixibacteria bacterium]MDH3938751.1 proline racemase family protein [candidate division Zixibacteria bacterium]MDH4032804.1 proline racemase family protein [candidate division Zixibacteria bacterium]
MKAPFLWPRCADDWEPPAHWLKIRTIDAHTGGEPLRIILDGFPELPGKTILDRRRYLLENLDHLRTTIMWEPRGHADMYGCLTTPPVTEGSDFGVLFMHNEGYSSMCGHGIIAVTKVAVELGLVSKSVPVTQVRIDTPSGLVTSFAHLEDESVTSVSFRNVASFAQALNETIELPELGAVSYNLAFGGAFYAFVDAAQVGLECVPEHYAALIDTGMRIKRAIMQSRPVIHPFEPDLSFLYGTIFTGPPADKSSHSRHVCIFAEGEVDRSPTGTGVSARLALLAARNEIALDETVVIESIIGSKFTGRIVEETTFGEQSAVIPEVGGSAYITGRHEFLIDPNDPRRDGFILR